MRSPKIKEFERLIEIKRFNLTSKEEVHDLNHMGNIPPLINQKLCEILYSLKLYQAFQKCSHDLLCDSTK